MKDEMWTRNGREEGGGGEKGTRRRGEEGEERVRRVREGEEIPILVGVAHITNE